MKKKILSVLIMLLIGLSIFVTGCSCTPNLLGDNPPTEAMTTSNGGMSVVKGDYLYFVNGYVDENKLTTKDNKEGQVTRGAIYRTKLEDGEIVKDKDGFLDDNRTDRVVSRVVGFSNGGFYIIDDTIYYATPYMMLEKDGTLLSDRVEFRSININGDTKTDKQVFVTDTHMDNLDWTMYKVDGEVYLVTFVNNSIYSVKASTGDVVAKVDKISTYAFYHEENYATTKSREGNKFRYVYYTRATTTEDRVSANFSGNAIAMIDITNGNVSVALNRVNNDNLAIVRVIDNYVYYTKTISNLKYLYRHDTRGDWDNNATDLTNGVAYSSYYPCEFGDYVIATNDNGVWLVSHGNAQRLINSDSITVIKVYGDYAYYINSDVLYRFKITDPTEKIIVSGDEETIKSSANLIDYDSRRLYVFTRYNDNEDNYYLNYIDDNSLEQRFVGVFESSELPEAPEQADKYGEDPDVEYIPHID